MIAKLVRDTSFLHRDSIIMVFYCTLIDFVLYQESSAGTFYTWLYQ